MLRITLYKNCILNEDYKNVLSTGKKDNISILEKYLNKLQKYQISNLDEVYYKNEGKLNFDLELVNEQDIYQYNYMKMEYLDEDEILLLTRYCFIKDIQINNEIVILSYNEDVFSSYSNNIVSIKSSYLDRSRRLDYLNKKCIPHYLPIEYTGNNILDFENLGTNINEYYILLSIQFYDGETIGNTTKRYFRTFLISRDDVFTSAQTTEHYLYRKFNLNDAIELMTKIVVNQSKGNNIAGRVPYTSGTFFDNYNYSLEDFILIPAWSEINIEELFEINTEIPYISQIEIELDSDFLWFDTDAQYARGNIIKENYANEKILIHSEKIKNNYKRISIGTFNTQIDALNNGTDFEINYYLDVEDTQCRLFINYLNNFKDITKDFTYEIPFKAILGEENSLLKIKKDLSELSNVISIASSIFLMAYGGLYAKSYGISNISKNINDIVEKEIPYYTSNKGTFVKTDAILNIKYYCCSYSITPDNEEFVKDYINNNGFKVNEYLNSLNEIDFYNIISFEEENINYNFIRFKDINIIGNFPRNIANKLNEIFKNGIKIWYNENIQEDEYIGDL